MHHFIPQNDSTAPQAANGSKVAGKMNQVKISICLHFHLLRLLQPVNLWKWEFPHIQVMNVNWNAPPVGIHNLFLPLWCFRMIMFLPICAFLFQGVEPELKLALGAIMDYVF